MLKFSVIFLFYLLYTIRPQEDYTTFDYCSITEPGCIKGAHPDHGGHAACNCTSLPKRAEVRVRNLKAIIAFRKKILHIHNHYRNWIASRQETLLPGAADMMVLNWDSELEHLARCRALNSYRPRVTVEQCRFNSKREYYSQNWYRSNEYGDDLNLLWNEIRLRWYDQIEYVTEDIIDSFHVRNDSTGFFTQLVWAKATHVGCVRVWNVEDPFPGWKMVVICDYKSTISPYPGNIHGWPVYKKGEACSACHNGTKCETPQYPALCGKLQRVPRNNVTVLGDNLEEGPYMRKIKKRSRKKSTSIRSVGSWLLIAVSISFLVKT